MKSSLKKKKQRLLEVKGLYKSFGTTQVLEDISFSVEKGQSIVIIGPSGSGKSTLLFCINNLEPINRGKIVFDGITVDESQKSRQGIRTEIGIVFQHFELFPHLNVLENIILAPTKVRKIPMNEARDKAYALLEKVHIPEKADAYPEELSGGQQQRVAIARALAMTPKLMLFDEPTSALDPEMIKEVLDVMMELSSEGMTSLIVTHEMGFARRVANRILFMEEGKIIENAEAEKFFNGGVHPRTREFLKQILEY
jgi:polar amino acid transport system ATP-binding protein